MENMLIEFNKDQQIQKYKQQLKDALTYAKGCQIVDQKSMSLASDQLKLFKTISKDLDKRRLDFFRPYEEAKKKIKSEVDFFTDPAKEGIGIIEQRLNDYLNAERIKEELRVKEEQERIRKETEEKLNSLNEAQQTSGVDLTEVIEAEAAEMVRKMDATEQYKFNTGKAKGSISTTSQRFTMDAEVYDIYKFLKWVGEEPEKRWNFVKVNEASVRARAKDIDKEGEWPNGIKTFKKAILTTR